MRKGKLCFVLLFLVLFYWPSLAQSQTDLFDKIGSITDLELERRGDLADVYYPDVSGYKDTFDDAFPIVAVLQGAGVDKSFYSHFGEELARYGFVVVIPNHLQIFPPGSPPPATYPLPDQNVILDVLTQMKAEDVKEKDENGDPNPLFGIIDTTRLVLAGHSFGGAVGLFAIEGSCNPPFCFGFFQRPQELRAGAFYGTNSFDLEGNLIDVDTDNFPVALVQGLHDGIATPEEAKATFDILDGVRALFSIDGANHYGITDVNNPGAVPPNFIPPTPDLNVPTIPQAEAVQQVAQATGRFLRSYAGIDLSVSSAKDRSDTKPLEGATLSGKAYIFLTPLYPDGDIEQVDFFLDGSFVKTEFWAPYDLKGTYRRGNPAPFDTRTLKDGSHNVRAEIVFPSGVQSIESDFTTRNYESEPNDFRLSVSFSPDRSRTIPLEGATLSGNAYIFLTPLFPDENIDEVDFFLDGLFVKTESWAPYDLKGTRDGGIPVPFDTRTLDNGSHSVRAEIEFATGEVEAVASKFSVFNDSDSDDDDDDD